MYLSCLQVTEPGSSLAGYPGHSGPAFSPAPQVSAGHILYEHMMPSEPFWEVHDTLELRLSSPPAPDLDATLTVTVSFEVACPQRPSRLWKNKGGQHVGLAKCGIGPGVGQKRELGWRAVTCHWTQGLGSAGVLEEEHGLARGPL